MEVGQGKVRVDAYAKVCGEAKYTADLEPKNILHGKVLHSEAWISPRRRRCRES